jgi:hypothetical protein
MERQQYQMNNALNADTTALPVRNSDLKASKKVNDLLWFNENPVRTNQENPAPDSIYSPKWEDYIIAVAG